MERRIKEVEWKAVRERRRQEGERERNRLLGRGRDGRPWG